jgi:putative aldouronate transport system permease protein
MKAKRWTIFDAANLVLMAGVCFATLYPFWFVIVNSLNEGLDAMRGGIYWWPRVFSVENYRIVFKDAAILTAFAVSVARTAIATTLNVLFTAMVSFALSKRFLIGRRFYMAAGMVTLFFGGGLIPYFLLIRGLGLLDSFLVYVFPTMFSFYNLLIFQAFFREIPAELEESARIDGAGNFLILVRVTLPLSGPVLATLALFVGVYNWNDFFYGVIFINNTRLHPIQTFLYRVIAESQSGQMITSVLLTSSVQARRVTAQAIRMATMVVSTAPIVCVYPFLQRYFVKGVLLGSIKG